MEKAKYRRAGQSINVSGNREVFELSEKEVILRLTEQVYNLMTRKFSQGVSFDVFEEIIKKQIEHDGMFECSQANISEKIIAVHDVDDQVTSLLVGPYYEYRNTVLEKFSHGLSSLIYESGKKEEIITIMFAILLKEMKNRFSERGSGYVYSGVEGAREEGVIKLK